MHTNGKKKSVNQQHWSTTRWQSAVLIPCDTWTKITVTEFYKKYYLNFIYRSCNMCRIWFKLPQYFRLNGTWSSQFRNQNPHQYVHTSTI